MLCSKPAAGRQGGAAHKEVRCLPDQQRVIGFVALFVALAKPFLFFPFMAVAMHVFALQTNGKNGDLLHPLCLTSLDTGSRFIAVTLGVSVK